MEKASVRLITLAALVSFVAIHFSPGIASIGTALLTLASVPLAGRNKPDNVLKWLFITACAFAALHLFGFVMGGADAEGWRKLLVKLPIFILPLLLFRKGFPSSQLFIVFMGFALSCAAVAIPSTVNYFLHADEMNRLISQSKPVPVFTQVYHIQFSVYLAWSIMLLLWMLVNREKLGISRFWRLAVIFLAVINFFCLHILSARTGLLGFYAALFTGGVAWSLSVKKPRYLIWIALFLVVPALSVKFLPSLNSRMGNTMEDLNTVKQNSDPNDKSFAQRWEAWKTAIHILKEKPLGIGLSQVDTQMQQRYTLEQSTLTRINRKNPHNQFLETALQCGIPAAVLLILMLAFPLLLRINPLFWAFCALAFTSFMFESMLERQASVLWFAFFFYFTARSAEDPATDEMKPMD